MLKGNKFYFFNRFKEKHIPLHIQLELTTRCNHDCIHCIREKNMKNELKTQEIKNLLSDLAEAGCMQLTFTGGEPLLREDFFALCSFAKSQGFALRLFSNATLIDRAVTKELKKMKFKEIRISLFSFKEELHDSITRSPGSLRKTLKAISFLRKDNIPFRISAVVMKKNIFELKMLREKAKEKNWQFICDPMIYPTYSGAKFPVYNRITNKQIEFLKNKHLLNYSGFRNINSKRNELNYFYLGNLHCYISSDGRVFPHATVRLELGNLKRQSFREIWENSPHLKGLRNLDIDNFACSHCSYFLNCTWNLGLALSEQKSLIAQPKEYCRITNILRREL